MTVTWVNIDNQRSATQNLTNAARNQPGRPSHSVGYRRYRPRTRSLGDQRFADHPAGRRRSHHLQLPSDRGHVRGSLIEVL